YFQYDIIVSKFGKDIVFCQLHFDTPANRTRLVDKCIRSIASVRYNIVDMRINTFSIVALLVILPLAAIGQDPTKVAPESYKLQFENAWIKVLRVSYAPNSKVPVHDHSKGPAGYVYLVDSGPVRFVHSGWDADPVLTRQATKAGSFRLSPTRFDNETHAVENISNTRSDFLRIEINTEAPDRQSLNARVGPFNGNRANGLNKIEFENSQLRVTRIISKPGSALTIAASGEEPTLLVALTPAVEFTLGQTIWLQAKETKTLGGESGQVELLRFDFKTKPKK
ncbi:MAG: hypothetical protein ACJ72Z_12365, partial [Pyrinomonadaceae bacterium]